MMSHLATPPLDRRELPGHASESTTQLLARPTSGLKARLELPAQAVCVRSARHFTDVVLRSWGVPTDEVDAVVLVVSELAGNAVRHGRDAMTLSLALTGGTLHVEVVDHGDLCAGSPGGDYEAAEHGRGMGIVAAVATSLAVVEEAWGRRVRVTYDVRDAVPRPAGVTEREQPMPAVVGRADDRAVRR